MRKLLATAAASLLALGVAHAGPAAAESKAPTVSVIQISGLLDRVQADFWRSSITQADKLGDEALVVQLDSNRSVLSDARFDELRQSIAGATTPVAVWVGPARTGAVGGEVAKLLSAADVVSVAPGAKVAGPP